MKSLIPQPLLDDLFEKSYLHIMKDMYFMYDFATYWCHLLKSLKKFLYALETFWILEFLKNFNQIIN